MFNIEFFSSQFFQLANFCYKKMAVYLCTWLFMSLEQLCLRENRNLNLQASVRHAKTDRHAVYLMSYCYSLPSSVLLSLGNMAAPRGRPLSVILLFGQMDAAGTASTSSWLHVCPLQGHLTPAHFDEHVFFSKPPPPSL